MPLNENHLAVVLQASLERARELLEADGGFLPFGARAKSNGEIEFVQLAPDSESETLAAQYKRLGAGLAQEARTGQILGSALVANARLPDEKPGEAIAVLVETSGFSRSVVVPYRLENGSIELATMLPEEAEPVVFAG